MSLSHFFGEINSCKYIYLREIAEPRDNRLRLIIEEASAGSVSAPQKIGGVLFSDLHPIESTHHDRLFELVWDSYIAYSIRNESFVMMDKAEVVESGRLMCVYSKSHFLDYVSKSTFATNEHPGEFKHFGINCLNHIVDVVSVLEPEIRQLRPGLSPPTQDQIH
jgi:hypothetical protein